MTRGELEEHLNQIRDKARSEILTTLEEVRRVENSVISLSFSNALMACGESTVDVYGPVSVPLGRVMEEDRIRDERRMEEDRIRDERRMEEDRIRDERRMDILKTLATINVRLKGTKNPIFKLLLKRHKKRVLDEAARFEAMPDIICTDERWKEVGMERAKSGAKVLDTEKEKSSRDKARKVYPVHHRTYDEERNRQRKVREAAKIRKEEEQRRQEEAEKEHQFRRRQIDRYLGDLKALDMEDSTVEEIEQFLEDLGPRDKEEEILASNLRKLLEKVKHERGAGK